jgi:hypothetical protein
MQPVIEVSKVELSVNKRGLVQRLFSVLGISLFILAFFSNLWALGSWDIWTGFNGDALRYFCSVIFDDAVFRLGAVLVFLGWL